MNKNSEIKSLYISEKWNRVYQALPSDGSPMRFKEIIKIFEDLHKTKIYQEKMSRTTISAALNYFCASGWVIKVEKSKKTVLYSRAKPNEPGINAALNFTDPITKLTCVLSSIPPSEYKNELVNLKNNNMQDAFFECQSIILNQYLINIDIYLRLMLREQAKNPNADELKNDIYLYLIPKIRELVSMVKDVGIDERTLPLLDLKERQHFTETELHLWSCEDEYKQEYAKFCEKLKQPPF